MSKKILYLSRFYPPTILGGAEVMAHGLVNGMVFRGHECTVLAGKTQQTLDDIIRIEYTPPNVFNGNEISDSKRSSFSRAVWHLIDTFNPFSYRMVKSIIDMYSPQIVHSHNIDSLSTGVWKAAYDCGLPVVHTSHDYHLFCPRATLLHRNGKVCENTPLVCRAYKASRLLPLRWVSKVVCPSDFMHNKYVANGIAEEKLCVIRNGVIGHKAVGGVGGRELRSFLYIGQLEPHKGVEIILDALKILDDPRVRLTIAGRGSLEGRVASVAASDGRIRYVGFVDSEKRAELMNTHRFILVPSIWYENAPMVVVEALVAGMVPVVSAMGGLPELVRVSKCGVIVYELSQFAWANAMREVGSGEFLSATIPPELTMDGMLDAYERIYESL